MKKFDEYENLPDDYKKGIDISAKNISDWEDKEIIKMIIEPCFILCSKCTHYIVVNNIVHCDASYFEKSSINESLLFTPLDYDCISWCSKEKPEGFFNQL